MITIGMVVGQGSALNPQGAVSSAQAAQNPHKLAVHFSSKTDQHPTPQHYFIKVDKEYGPFDVDVCADKFNTKCLRFFSVEHDGLKQDWSGLKCWMNPPYGRGIGEWVKKAYEAAQNGATVACLLPSRTDTKWFQKYCLPVILGEVPGAFEFIAGRLKFGNATNAAPFPSLLIVFYPRGGSHDSR